MGTLKEDLTEIKKVEDTLTKNKVSRFAYTEKAYTDNDADGVPAYNIDNEQNIPIGTADIMKVNQTVIDRGYRAQASSITRMLLNHFLGRLSYNLNKVNDNVSSLLTTLHSHLGKANGIASLDENGRVPYSQLPESAMELKGEWDASTNTPKLVDGTGTNGDFYVVTVAGTQTFGGKSIEFQVNDRILYNGSTSTWIRLQAGGVYSVNEKTPDETGNINLESLSINGQNFNGSASVSVDTMKMIYGGTGATSAKGAEFNITADMKSQTSDFTDTTKITCVQESPSASNGRFFYSNASYLWNYIKSKISSVLGLTATAYGGKASTAGNADKASFLDEYPGAGGTRLTSLNIVPKDASEYGGMRKDVITDSVTEGNHPGVNGHLLTMFWDNSGRYDSQLFVSNNTPLMLKARFKANNADYGAWSDIITSNNIGSQTVETAKTARTAADAGFLCKLYQLDSATSDNTTQANNVILLGKIPDPASIEAPATPSASWDIDVDFYFVRAQGHKAAWCNVKAGYGYSNAWRKYGLIETFGVDRNSNYTYPFYLVTVKYNNEYYIAVRHMMDMDGSYAARVKNVNTNGNRNPSTADDSSLVNMLKVIPFQKTTDGTILNKEIKTSIADFPNTCAPVVERNGDLVLKSGYVRIGNSGVAGSKLTIHGATVNSNSYTDTNPKLEFKNNDGSQNISLTFTDYDVAQAPASLTLNGNQGNEYFIAPNIKATTNFIGNLKGTANKVANKLTINGQSFDGSSPLDINIYGAYNHIVYDDASLLEWANCTDGSMKKVLVKSGTYNMTKGVNLSQAGTGYVLAENGAVIESHVPVAFEKTNNALCSIYNLEVVCYVSENSSYCTAFKDSYSSHVFNKYLVLYNCKAGYDTVKLCNNYLFLSCWCFNCIFNAVSNTTSGISVKTFSSCYCTNCVCTLSIQGTTLFKESDFFRNCTCINCRGDTKINVEILNSTDEFCAFHYCSCIACDAVFTCSEPSLHVQTPCFGFNGCTYMSSCYAFADSSSTSTMHIAGIHDCSYISSTKSNKWTGSNSKVDADSCNNG